MRKMMKSIKIFVVHLVLTAALFTAAGYSAKQYNVIQFIHNPDGSSGEATSINAYGKGGYFRSATTDPVQYSTTIEYNVPSSPLPAYVLRDVGSQWGNNPSVGERIVGIVEIPGGLRVPYPHGLSYVGASSGVHSSGQTLTLPSVNVQPIPTPDPRSTIRDSIVISWPSIRTCDDSGNRINIIETYAVYRSEHPTGPFQWLSDVPHKDGEMTYEDGRISKGNTYYYKLKLRYSWPANRPPYYETAASSAASPGIAAK
jgi:hypothetical protein